MTTTKKTNQDPYRTVCHKDGTVTLWDVYVQNWVRGSTVSDRVLASLGADERRRVLAHLLQ